MLTEVYLEDYDKAWSIEPECSDYFYKNGWYYLISRSQYWISKAPFGPWTQPQDCNVDCGVVPKMAFWNGGRIIFTGFLPQNGYGGFLTFKEALQNSDGTLRFIPVKEMKV